MARLPSVLFVRYEEKSGVSLAFFAGTEVCIKRCWKLRVGGTERLLVRKSANAGDSERTGSEALGHELRADLGNTSSPSGGDVGTSLDAVAVCVGIVGRTNGLVQKRGMGNTAGECADGGSQGDGGFEGFEGGHWGGGESSYQRRANAREDVCGQKFARQKAAEHFPVPSRSLAGPQSSHLTVLNLSFVRQNNTLIFRACSFFRKSTFVHFTCHNSTNSSPRSGQLGMMPSIQSKQPITLSSRCPVVPRRRYQRA